MRKIHLIAFVLVLTALLVSCAQTQQAPSSDPSPSVTVSPSPSPSASPSPSGADVPDVSPVPDGSPYPAQIFHIPYNQIPVDDWPDGYTPYQVSLEVGEFTLYRYYLTAQDTDENVVAYFSSLLGDDSEENLAQNLAYLRDDGAVGTHGMLGNTDLPASVQIIPTDPEDEDYTYVEGFVVCLTVNAVADSAYEYTAFIDANTNAAADSALPDGLGLSAPIASEVRVNLNRDCVQSQRYYAPADYEAFKQAVTNDPDWEQTNNGIRRYFGDLSVDLVFNDDEQVVSVGQWLSGTSTMISDYAASSSATLIGLGFNDYDQACGYEDETIWLAVAKHEWGNDENIINSVFEIYGQPCRVIVSYPDQLYTIMIGEENDRIDYTYDPFTDTITPSLFFATYDTFKAAYEALTGETSDNSVKAPALFLDEYTQNTFGYKPEALFELPKE